ncbi:hypothetical protein AgCh_015853 [Apium graveolens]
MMHKQHPLEAAAVDVVKAAEVMEMVVDMEEPVVKVVEVDMEVVVKAVAVDMEAVVVVMVEEEREVMVVTEADEWRRWLSEVSDGG